MTNEKAIDLLDNLIGMVEDNQESDYDTALKMAIQALSQEPCDKCVYSTKDGYCQYDDISETIPPLEPCDDAVSREAALIIAGTHTLTVDETVKAIKNLPPVTQKSKTGHWIKKEDDTCWWYVCSECEQEPLKNRWNDDDVLSSFCPNCGAKMESEGAE